MKQKTQRTTQNGIRHTPNLSPVPLPLTHPPPTAFVDGSSWGPQTDIPSLHQFRTTIATTIHSLSHTRKQRRKATTFVGELVLRRLHGKGRVSRGTTTITTNNNVEKPSRTTHPSHIYLTTQKTVWQTPWDFLCVICHCLSLQTLSSSHHSPQH